MLHFRIDAAGPIKTFEGIARRAEKPADILKRWGGYFRSKAHQRADAAEGWAPLSTAYRAKLEATRTAKITSFGQLRTGYAVKLESYLRLQQVKGTPSAAADIAEFRRLRSGGSVDRDAKGKKAAAWAGSKAIDRLRRGMARAQDQRAKGKRATVGGDKRKSANHKMLGSVARQITWKVEGNGVTTMSRVPWSNVHNHGGAVGNGASVPARTFLAIRAEDLEEMNKIAVQHLMGVR